MPRAKVTPEIEERIIQLHRANQTYKSIGRQLELDWRTVKGVVSRVAKVREQDHWEAVTRQVDAELLRQHYSVLMLVAQEVRAVVSMDPIERIHEESQVVLERAQSRAVHRAMENGILPGIPPVTRASGTDGNIRLVEHGYLIFESLEEHEPQLKTLITRWAHTWDAVILEKRRLTTEVKTSLLADETKKDLEKQELKPSQVEDIFNGALTEALERKLKHLKPMEFETPIEGSVEVIRRVRTDPYYKVGSHIYIGGDPDTAQKFYERTLELALQQPEIWDKFDNAYQDVMRWTENINHFIATLALRGRPAGKCTLCPSAGA